VVVRVDPDRLRSYKVSPDEVVSALAAGNAISPSGNVRIGDAMPIVPVNSLVRQVKDLESIPIKVGPPPGVYLRDVATVRDASDIPTGYALVNGRRAVYILVTKRADASTLSVVSAVKQALPKMQDVLPDDIRVSFEFDQSPTVTRAVRSLAAEGTLGAVLTGLMVLLFLRDWRSVLVVVLNIPFALAGALVALWVSGQTINLMTLGGLALAVGILVDEATVEIENIHHKLGETDSVARAVRQGNHETAVPRLLAMLCVLAVFIPALFMTGPARSLFVPLSLAVGTAMVASYLLSSTFVPVLAAWLLRPHRGATRAGLGRPGGAYARTVSAAVRWRWALVPAYAAVVAAVVFGLGRGLGLEIFPAVDAGRFQLRLKAPAGTRIERTEQLVVAALDAIGREVGPGNVGISVGYVGNIPPSYPINAIYQWTGGPEEAILRVALRPGAGAIGPLKERLRDRLKAELPGVRLSFEPADIVSEVMSFGSPTPVEVAVTGPSLAENRAYAEKVRDALADVPSLRDLQFVQALDYPTVNVEIDRERAGFSGVTAAEVARSLVEATSSSRFVVPNYWPDPKTGIGYQVQVEVPYTMMDSIGQVETIPVQHPGGENLLLRDVARVTPGTMPGEFDRYNMKRTVSLTANLAGEDLGRVAGRVDRAIGRAGPPPRGATVDIRGQVVPLREILTGLSVGLGVAVVVILLLLTANFQSVRLALVVVSTTPAVLAGVVAALWLTGTTINLQSFMGATMAIGVAVANAILLVTFAERHRREGASPGPEAAVEGARGRLRPILMTTGAMIAGMVPMALGLGEGGEQTAPLGRAVVGGLSAATVATLLVLPAVFALVQSGAGRHSASLDPDDPGSPRFDPSGAGLDGQAGAPPRGPVMVGVLALAVSLAGSAGCEGPPDVHAGAAAAKAAATVPTRVEVVHPERQTVRKVVEQPGQIEASETTPIHAKLSGFARKVNVDIGDRVTHGQVLAKLWAPEVEADLAQKRAAVDQALGRQAQAEAAVRLAQATIETAGSRLTEAKAGVKRAESDEARWRSEYDRARQLASDRAVTANMLDESRNRHLSALAGLDAVRAGVASAEAEVGEARAGLEKARADVTAAAAGVEFARAEARRAEALLGYARVESPFDGVVTRRNVDTGHLTEPGPRGTPLFVVARTDLVTAVVGVPEAQAGSVGPGDRASVRVQTLGGRAVEAKVTRTSRSLDPATRTLRVEIDLPNQSETLLPGLYVYAAVVADERPDALTVPTAAVVREGVQTFCVAVRQGRAVRLPVEVGLSDGTRTEILSGLASDEAIVNGANVASLADGQPVEPTGSSMVAGSTTKP
jgi:RND family efflux transporter MFP subunit